MASAAPAYASVTILRIPGFGARTIVEQSAAKDRLEDRVRRALAAIPAGKRIVLDSPDGIGIVYFGAPARALDLARGLREGPGEEALKVGLSHGPIALSARDVGGKVFGDGLAAAAAAARFASPGRVLVTSAFAKLMEAMAPARAAELAPAGEFTDSRVRLHSLYTPDPERLVERRHRLAAYALSGILVILVLGVAGRALLPKVFPPRPAIVELDVRPRGDVFVDDVSYGRAPPLTQIEVPPGRHRVQVRLAGYPPLEIRVNLEPGERMAVAHTFGSGARKAQGKEGFWQDLRKRLGL
jgi:hypothetical protein